MKRIIFLLFLFLLLKIDIISIRIAVLDFDSGSGVDEHLGADVSELIRIDMIKEDKFTVIERNKINEIMDEIRFQESGCTDISCAVEIGKILIANKIITGRVSKFGKSFMISLRLVDIEKGIAEFAEMEMANSDSDIPKTVKILIHKLLRVIESSGEALVSEYPEVQWIRQLDLPNTLVDFNITTWIKNVETDHNGNVYFVGSYNGSVDGQKHYGNNDIFIIKYNNNGVKQWTRQWGTPLYEKYEGGIAIDHIGNIYICGTITDTFHEKSDESLFLNPDWIQEYIENPDKFEKSGGSLFLLKYNPDGKMEWVKTMDSRVNGYGATVDKKGNVYVTGGTYIALDGQNHFGHQDGFLTKFNSKGKKKWTRQFGSKGSEYGYAITLDKKQDIYIAGPTDNAFDDQSNYGRGDGFLIKFNSKGKKIWTRQFGTNKSDDVMDIAIDGYNNIYITGFTAGAFDGQINQGSDDVFIVKYNPKGDNLWIKQFGTPLDDYAWGVAIDSKNNVYVGGETNGAFPEQTQHGAGDFLLKKFDKNGNEIWVKQWGTENIDCIQGITVDNEDNIFIIGASGNITTQKQDSLQALYYHIIMKLSYK